MSNWPGWPFMSTMVDRLTEKRMRYVGHIGNLFDKTALVRDDPNSNVTVLAQFDDQNAQRSGDDLAHGWHVFHATEFEEIA